MSKMQTSGFIEDASFKDAVIGVGSALGMFAIARFFKNGDSLRDRVRILESGQKVTETKLDNLQIGQEEIKKYLHDKLHDVINVLNSKMTRDSFKVEEVKKDLEQLKQLIKDKK